MTLSQRSRNQKKVVGPVYERLSVPYKSCMNRLSVPHGSDTSSSICVKDRKRVHKADSLATEKEKKHRQGLQLLRTRQEEARLEIKAITYEPGGF